MSSDSKRRRRPQHSTTRRPPPARVLVGTRQRIHPYVSASIRRRLFDYCAGQNLTESAVVEDALTHYLEMPDSLLIMRRLDRLGRSLERSHRDLELLSQGFALFVQCWFAHAPTLPANQKDAVRRSAASRFQQFMEQLAEQYSGGHRFLDDLPKVQFPDDAELEAAATVPGAAPPTSDRDGGKP